MNIRKEVETRLRGHIIGSQSELSNPVIYCKLFNAFGTGTWYLSEYDGEDTAFGYVTGFTDDEWGYVSISELVALRMWGNTPRIECDLYFKPARFSSIKTLKYG